MWKLTIEDDEGTKTLLPLVREEYHLGRDEKNTIRLTERNISRRHATLKKGTSNDWEVIDNESYNGCYVNGQRVAGAVPLAHSDLIQLGDYRIFISNDAMIEADTPAVSGSVAGAVASAASSGSSDRLVVLVGPEPGLEYPLDKGNVTIGRAEDCTISVNHPSVSRVHAEVKPLGGGRYEIVDRGSSNGVRVNGTDLRRALLEGGDLIELGDVKLRYMEHGQVYRIGADVSQQIEAVTSRPAKSVRPSSAPRTRSTASVVGIALGALAVIGVVGFVALRGSGEQTSAAAATAPVDPGAKLLADAQKARQAGDYAGSIALLGQIPDSSPAKQSPEAKQMFSDWADFALRQAQDTATDKDDRRSLLKKVAQNTSVDGPRRKTASDLLLKLDAAGTGTDIDKLPPAGSVAAATPPVVKATSAADTAPAPAPTPTQINADPAPPNTAVAGVDPAGKGPTAARPKDDKKDKDKKDDATVAASGNPITSDGETAMRKGLENRVWSGKGTRDEIKMLKAICQHQNDKACRDRASQLLKN